jgi:chromosome segregation ATPase
VDGGFIDLRGNRDTGTGTDSFWPSFTDIMMVVVMIFMIASTMLMLRNWDLVQELRTTLEAEREAEEQAREAEQLARSMFETSATLEEQLAQAQHANSELRIQLMRANEENRSLRAQVSLHEQQLTLLQSEQQQLTASLQQSRRDARLQADQLQQAQAQYEQLTTARDTLQQRLQQVLAELEQSETSRQQEAVELDTLRQSSMLSVQQLASLQGEYDELRVKYDKLVKPARSAKGKYMVSVRYWKEGEYYQIRIKKMEETAYRTVSSKELHQELSQLKQQYPGSLYVKLIIPDDSGLSYNEAWGFTMDVLEKYDYYHQGD